MSSVAFRVIEQGEHRSEGESYRDSSLADLSADARLRLQRWKASHWLSSPGFAESYCHPPAQRVSYITGVGEEVVDACFYREEKWAGAFKSMSLCGEVHPASRILLMLRRQRTADLIRVPFLSSSAASQQQRGPNKVGFREMAHDHCIELPKSPEEYLKSLGGQTRKHLPYYLRRLKKEWGNNWKAEHTSGSQITKKAYRDLLALNALRMSRKGRRSLWTKEISDQRWTLVREIGSVESIFHEGRLVAGTLSFTYGSEAYLTVIAHDPEEDRLNLGNVCLWLTIEHFIGQGLNRYHLLWGNSSYKKQFGAVAHPLYEMTMFANSRAAKVWRTAELLHVEKAWRLSNAAVRKIGCLLWPAWRFHASQGGPE